MSSYILLTRVSTESIRSPKSLEELEKEVVKRIQCECPAVEWLHNFAVLGPYDYLDVFRAPDNDTAFKVAAIVRSFGHATTEIWAATEWAKFKEMIRAI
jgi:uncharacterized protein with GYD domain